MEGIGQEARSQLYEYNSQNLANSVRAGARSSQAQGSEVQRACRAARICKAVPPKLPRPCRLNPASIPQPFPTAAAFVAVACSGSAYAGASAPMVPPFHPLLTARPLLHAPPPPQVWAYANIGVNPGEELLQDFARAAIQRMPEFRWGETNPRVLPR